MGVVARVAKYMERGKNGLSWWCALCVVSGMTGGGVVEMRTIVRFRAGS